jgi:hypothetical protein
MGKGGVCRLTRQHGKFVRAHIIPKSFFLETKEGDEPMEIIHSKGAHPPKRNWTGIYDETLVIADGEKYFDELDDYAYKLLCRRPSRTDYLKDADGFIIRGDDGKPLGYQIATFEYPKLRRFFDSILWRMSASTHDFYASVKLDFEETLRSCLLDRTPSERSLYNIQITRHLDELGGITFSPHRLVNAPFSAIRSVCGRFSFTFVLDDTQAEISEAFMTDKRLIVLTWPLEGTNYPSFAKRAVLNTSERWGQ